MAIKRTTKGRGTPVRATATTPAVRHVEVRMRQHMVPGNVYTGWLCKNKSCGLVIAIATAPEGSKPAVAESDDRLTVLKCPHCGNEDLYRWIARGEHPYTAGTAST